MSVFLSAPIRAAMRPDATPQATPYLDLDLACAVRRYRELERALPGAQVHYAVKANPHPRLLSRLAAHGCRFDVASPQEVQACLTAGARPHDLVYSNPVKSRRDLAEAAMLGVDLFVVDSEAEIDKVADTAPGASVLCRLLTSGAGSDWPLSRKYGCTEHEAASLLVRAARQGLGAAGLSFHVGSQQRDPWAWQDPIEASARVFDAVRSLGLRPWILDLGGGFPATLEGDVPGPAAYGAAITEAVARSFRASPPTTLIEPGRGIVADAGVLVTSVISVVYRGDVRWVFLDAGVFTGLVETLDEAVRYRLETDRPGEPVGPCVLAGPTCDSADVLYERTPVQLPLTLAEGDQVRILAAGAYTSCYSTVGFNGFAPLATVVREQGD
jgi:ornithine decarboxylase